VVAGAQEAVAAVHIPVSAARRAAKPAAPLPRSAASAEAAEARTPPWVSAATVHMRIPRGPSVMVREAKGKAAAAEAEEGEAGTALQPERHSSLLLQAQER